MRERLYQWNLMMQFVKEHTTYPETVSLTVVAPTPQAAIEEAKKTIPRVSSCQSITSGVEVAV